MSYFRIDLATGPDIGAGKVTRENPEPEDRPEGRFDTCVSNHRFRPRDLGRPGLACEDINARRNAPRACGVRLFLTLALGLAPCSFVNEACRESEGFLFGPANGPGGPSRPAGKERLS